MSIRRMMMNSFGGYSSELQAIISRANTEGFTLPSSTTLAHIDALIASLKSEGIWAVADYLRVSALNNTACGDFARINMANPTGTLSTVAGGISYLTTGYKGNKINGLLSSEVNLAATSHYVQNSACRLYVLASSSTNGVSGAFEGLGSSVANRLNNGLQADQRINQATANLSSTFSLGGTGTKAIVRVSSTSVELTNSATQATRTATSAPRSSDTQQEFRSFNVFSDTTHAFSLYSGALTGTQIQNFRTMFNTYLTSIGLTAFA
jgi:hypothetical protein